MRIGDFSVFVRNDTWIAIYVRFDAGGLGGVFGPCSVVFHITLLHISLDYFHFIYIIVFIRCIYTRF